MDIVSVDLPHLCRLITRHDTLQDDFRSKITLDEQITKQKFLALTALCRRAFA